MRKVIYNGGSMRYYSHGDLPDFLEIGNEYTVVEEIVSDFHTEYILKEVPGEYNSLWFDPVLPSFIAISDSVPVVGGRLHCHRFENGKFVKVNTSVARQVQLLGVNTYKVRTRNSIYVVQVH